MKLVEVDLVSTAPYSQSRKHNVPKLNKEKADDHDKRTWREKCTTDANGIICIPAMAFKQAIDSAAKMLGMGIEGKGKHTYTKHFRAGVICERDVSIGVHKDQVPSVTISAHANGIRGSGSRVDRMFPQVASWKATATFAILDDTITPDVFEKHLIEAGRFVGVGRFRPENGGLNGRFEPKAFRWSDI
jgi:hypothetical protein